MLQHYGTYIYDIGPYKLCYNAHIPYMLLEVCKATRTEGVKNISTIVVAYDKKLGVHDI